MTFDESLKKLGIEEYSERILNSNSRGELSHLQDYFLLAEYFTDKEPFPELFKGIVKLAEQQWKRPESVFQHIPVLLKAFLIALRETIKDYEK